MKNSTTLKLHNFDDLAATTIALGDLKLKRAYTANLEQHDDGFDELVEDIRLRGIEVPIFVDEHGNVIDGWLRIRAAKKLGLTHVPVRVLARLSEAEKHEWAEALNVCRRQLNKEQIRQVVRTNKKTLTALAINKAKEGKSLRQIADECGVSHETIRARLQKAAASGVELPSDIIGKNGKQYKVETRKKPTVDIYTIDDAVKAIKACSKAGSKLRNRRMSLKSAERAAEKEADDQLRQNKYSDLKTDRVKLLLGDFRERADEIPDESLDIVFTDPPYAHDALHLWDSLSQIAAKKLKPGGVLISYTGVQFLPSVFNLLGNYLEYRWMGTVRHMGRTKLVRDIKFINCSKPILIYAKQPVANYWQPFNDLCECGCKEKSLHPWQQSAAEAAYYLKHLAPPDATAINMWDPLMGSGSSIIGALLADPRYTCIGCEIDKAAYAKAEERIKTVQENLNTRKKSA